MKYAQMVCATSRNIGDDIQWIAVAQALPRIDMYLDREELNSVVGADPICIIMNGWFLERAGWPPSDILRPIFVGFHATSQSHAIIAQHVDYLKRYEPIGTRDQGTADFLNSLGIRTEVTYCMSLTFPVRSKPPANGKVIRVDADGIEVPKSLRRGSIEITHRIKGITTDTKRQYARDLVEFYRDNARLVITTRLHCALPCIGMGIPVVFFGDPTDNRTSIVREIGGTIHNRRAHPRGGLGKLRQWIDPVDWSPPVLDASQVKASILKAVSERMNALNAQSSSVPAEPPAASSAS